MIKLSKASGHNLKNVDLELPLDLFVCVTGVSGSGKSTLINQTLLPAISNEVSRAERRDPKPFKGLSGIQDVDKIIEISQSPIGRTPRSNPATYTGLFTPLRELFAGTQEARSRGYKIGRFSFNVSGGRCENCKGGGMKLIEMNFLPDVFVECEVCNCLLYTSPSPRD